MTAYVANTGVSSSGSLTVTPVSSEIRIAQVSFNSADGGTGSGNTIQCSTYLVGGTSGGTAVTPLPMRQGAPAATATSKSGATWTSITNVLSVVTGSGPTLTYTDGTTGYYTTTVSGAWQPPFDLIISPGTTLYAQANGNSGVFLFIHFEELRLSWPY
jgi:hypothetical protein